MRIKKGDLTVLRKSEHLDIFTPKTIHRRNHANPTI